MSHHDRPKKVRWVQSPPSPGRAMEVRKGKRAQGAWMGPSGGRCKELCAQISTVGGFGDGNPEMCVQMERGEWEARWCVWIIEVSRRSTPTKCTAFPSLWWHIEVVLWVPPAERSPGSTLSCDLKHKSSINWGSLSSVPRSQLIGDWCVNHALASSLIASSSTTYYSIGATCFKSTPANNLHGPDKCLEGHCVPDLMSASAVCLTVLVKVYSSKLLQGYGPC